MSRTYGINPIENIEQAMLNPGGDESTTHIENENKVIHDIDQVVISAIEASVTQKLTNIIKGYYNSPNGVYPLTEFYFYFSEDYLEIYDRWGAHLIDIGIGSFTAEEISWISNNLPYYNKGTQYADRSQVHLDFCPLRNDGWMVFRRSGTFNSLIGIIRKKLPHVTEPRDVMYYFEDRQDSNIVSKFEKEMIDDFIHGTQPTIDVTNIMVDYNMIKLLIGGHKDISITVYPPNAEDLSYSYELTSDDVASYDDSIHRVTGIGEGLTELIFTSNSNPEVQATVDIEVIEYDKLYNTKYTIVRGDTEGYGIDENYIIGMDEGLTINQFVESFKNKDTNLSFKTPTGDEISHEEYWQWITTGMTVSLYANGKFYEQLRIIVRGDIDDNGAVNEYDKQCIRNHVNGAVILEGYNFIAADVNKDKTVNLDDLNMLESYLNGEIPTLNKS